MLKNREFVICTVIQVILLIFATLLISHYGSGAFYICTVMCALIIIINIFYTRKRYQDIKALTIYLNRLQHGDASLELRDNTEGELSILKNEIYKVALTLLHQKELLEKDKKYLADSISDISHQLKTPITSMLMMADLLEDETLSRDKRKEFLHNIQIGIERMQWLVQSLLKISKLDAGSVVLKKEKIVVSQLVRKATQDMLITIELKNQSLVYEEKEEVSFLGDFAWTVEAISNIVKNCIEHTPVGGKIHISASQNNLYTQIEIVDNGMGIAKEDLPHIFERFYKGRNSSSDSVGIGLALARMIIVQQKGNIEVISKEKKGTNFIIKFYV